MDITFPKLSTIARADLIIKNCSTAQKSMGSLNFIFDKTTWIDPFAITKGFEGTVVNLKINADKETFYFLTEEEEYIF